MGKKVAGLTFVLLCLASTPVLAQQVSVNYNHNASFTQYHTYAWGSNNKNAIQNSILAQVAQQDIEICVSLGFVINQLFDLFRSDALFNHLTQSKAVRRVGLRHFLQFIDRRTTVELSQLVHWIIEQQQDLSLRDFAKKLGGLSSAYLSDIELGRRFPSDENLLKMAGDLLCKEPPVITSTIWVSSTSQPDAGFTSVFVRAHFRWSAAQFL